MTYTITAYVPTIHQLNTIRSFHLPVTQFVDGSFCAEETFMTEQEAKQHLCRVAAEYYDDPYEYEQAVLDIQRYGYLKIETIYANIEANGEVLELLTNLTP